VIERDEFVSLLEALDADLTDEQISAGLEALDRNRNGLIEFQEFIDWWAEKWLVSSRKARFAADSRGQSGACPRG
jgi:hypothetical protein